MPTQELRRLASKPATIKKGRTMTHAHLASKALLACALTTSLAVTATPSHALTSIDQGAWSNAKATHSCSGTSTNLTCRHTATTALGYMQSRPICIESDPILNRPLDLECGATLLTEPNLAYQRSTGAGTPGACTTIRTYSAAAMRPIVRITSVVLNRTFDVGVDIINNAGVSKISGTASTADGLTIDVEGNWTRGCGNNNGTTAEGVWSGTFTIAV